MPFQFLGTSGAIPTADRDNTALAVSSAADVVLVDCPGSPYQKLLKAGLDPMRVSALIVTHRHVDHLYGLPSLAHNLGLAGRRETLHVHAPAETLEYLHGFLRLFPLEAKMPYRIALHEVPLRAGHEILAAEGFRVRSSPVQHPAATLGLRVDWEGSEERGGLAYSCDTAPCPAVQELARGADALIHEATYLHEAADRANADGHTTAWQAGELAARAGVERLFLCHFHATLAGREAELREEARRAFPGPVEIPEEFRAYRADGA